MKYQFVKKLVSVSEWNNYYSQIPAYCFLQKGNEGVWIGFGIAKDELPRSCELCTDEELRQIDDYRQANNITPRPFKDKVNAADIKTIRAINTYRGMEEIFNIMKEKGYFGRFKSLKDYREKDCRDWQEHASKKKNVKKDKPIGNKSKTIKQKLEQGLTLSSHELKEVFRAYQQKKITRDQYSRIMKKHQDNYKKGGRSSLIETAKHILK